MPTTPDPGPAPNRAAHRQRHIAESFGEDAERYDRTRPRYPEALVTRVLAAVGTTGTIGTTGPADAAPRILDVGCGTGIVARQFLDAGCSVLGIEVDARMAVRARDTGIEVEAAAFERWDPAGRTFDAVVSGQTWHWIDPVAGASKAAAALRPGGLLAAFWNIGQPSPELTSAFAAVYREVAPEVPNPWAKPALDLYAPGFAAVADGIRRADSLGEPGRWRFDWKHPYTREQWLDQVPTHGIHTRMPPATLAAVLDGLGTAIDAAGGAFTMAYATVAITATARP